MDRKQLKIVRTYELVDEQKIYDEGEQPIVAQREQPIRGPVIPTVGIGTIVLSIVLVCEMIFFGYWLIK
jgi:hypothetical protein